MTHSSCNNLISVISRVLIAPYLNFCSLTSPTCCNLPRKCTPVKWNVRQKAGYQVVKYTTSWEWLVILNSNVSASIFTSEGSNQSALIQIVTNVRQRLSPVEHPLLDVIRLILNNNCKRDWICSRHVLYIHVYILFLNIWYYFSEQLQTTAYDRGVATEGGRQGLHSPLRISFLNWKDPLDSVVC